MKPFVKPPFNIMSSYAHLSAVAVAAYCLSATSLGKDLHRVRRDSLYDNIYSAISDKGEVAPETLEQLSRELPEQTRSIRQVGGFDQVFQQQPRAGEFGGGAALNSLNVILIGRSVCECTATNSLFRSPADQAGCGGRLSRRPSPGNASGRRHRARFRPEP